MEVLFLDNGDASLAGSSFDDNGCGIGRPIDNYTWSLGSTYLTLPFLMSKLESNT